MVDKKPKQTRSKRSTGNNTTLQDVAKHADVSTATVSRYLANPEAVKSERRSRIELAIKQLDYIPHGAAQALASQRTRTIGAIVPTLHNAIFAQGLEYFERRLQTEGYSLLVGISNYSPDEELTQAEKMMNRGIDGLLLVGLTHKEYLHKRIQANNIPYVSTWSYRDDYPYPCIGFKNDEAAIHLTQYLLDIGHKKFGIISGNTKDNDRATDRLKGFLKTLKENEIDIPAGNVIESAYNIHESRIAAKKLLSVTDTPTAIICGNDVIAYGVIYECQNQGVKVPEDVSIIGFDDLEASSQILPPLTTMQVPFMDMGEKAADYILSCINKETVHEKTELNVNLIVRNTTAPPKNNG